MIDKRTGGRKAHRSAQASHVLDFAAVAFTTAKRQPALPTHTHTQSSAQQRDAFCFGAGGTWEKEGAEASRAAHLKVGEGELDNEADGALALHKDVAQLNHILVAQLVEKLDLPQRSAVYPCRQSRAGVSV